MILSMDLRNTRLAVISDAIDSGSGSLDLFTQENEKVSSIPFSNPCALSIVQGVLEFKPLSEALILLSSTIAKGKVVTSTGTVLLDAVTVGDLETDADIKLQSALVYQGSLIKINSWSISE